MYSSLVLINLSILTATEKTSGIFIIVIVAGGIIAVVSPSFIVGA